MRSEYIRFFLNRKKTQPVNFIAKMKNEASSYRYCFEVADDKMMLITTGQAPVSLVSTDFDKI